MSRAHLTIDLSAVVANWQALNALTGCETGAVVKADAYGLGVAQVGRALAQAGNRRFFVAIAEEGATLRKALGAGPEIMVFAGHMAGDAACLSEFALTPMINSAEQLTRHRDALPDHPFGVQLDTGMNRLGMEPADWAELSPRALPAGPVLAMSHLACGDEPENPMNRQQLDCFRTMTDGIGCPRSLAATAGILLGPDYHFDLTRPGVGLYGGWPFTAADPVIRVDLPVIQIRDVAVGESVGYANSWIASRPSRIATVSGGYADGLIRASGASAQLFAGDTPCAVVGRVSMDMITADVTDLDTCPDSLSILCDGQQIDDLAKAAGTIGHEILTALGARYDRTYLT